MGAGEMDVDGGGDERNPSSNGGPERNPSLKRRPEKDREKEGQFLLGSPTFSDLGNGRLRCVETGHELLAKDRESYCRSKGCRLALIDAAVSQKKPPLNVFRPHPLSKSKLFCELTGATINKSEEHIWKHISGKWFQNKLELTEAQKLALTEKNTKLATILSEDQKQDADGNYSFAKKSKEHSSGSGKPDCWMPPFDVLRDSDDGRDRCEYSGSSGRETDGDICLEMDVEEDGEPVDISIGDTSMSKADLDRCSIALRKRKKKKKKKKIKMTTPRSDSH